MSPAPFSRSVLIAAAVFMTALVAGCGSAQVPGGPPPSPVLVEHQSANGKTVRVGVGDQIALILGSSYWRIRGSSAPGVLHQEGRTRFVASHSSCLPGVGCGSQRALFKALTPGTAVITAHRGSCGEALACIGSRGRFRLTVIVR